MIGVMVFRQWMTSSFNLSMAVLASENSAKNLLVACWTFRAFSSSLTAVSSSVSVFMALVWMAQSTWMLVELFCGCGGGFSGVVFGREGEGRISVTTFLYCGHPL